VFLDVKEYGEDWKKCIVSPLNKMDKQSILKILHDHVQKEQQDPKIKENVAKCIKLLSSHTNDDSLESICFRLTKKRKQISLSLNDIIDYSDPAPLHHYRASTSHGTKNYLLVEQTEFEPTPSFTAGKWKSICFEGADEQTLKIAYDILLSEFVNNSVQNNNTNKIYKMGYPEWIASVLRPSLHNSHTQTSNTNNSSNHINNIHTTTTNTSTNTTTTTTNNNNNNNNNIPCRSQE
jgi:hypothetical protein